MSEHKLFTKCALRLIPFMAPLFLVNYIDRVNVGFAALTMNKDLGFSPAVYGFGAGVFFIGYVVFQVPANVILERLPVLGDCVDEHSDNDHRAKSGEECHAPSWSGIHDRLHQCCRTDLRTENL